MPRNPDSERGIEPDASIVTVHYNSEAYLFDCLRSVAAATRSTFEQILVDNASEDREVLNRVRQEFPRVAIVENPRNLGFAAGCNAGIERASGRYVLFLNPDARLVPGALDEMVSCLDARPDVAVLGAPLVYADGSDQRTAGRAFPSPLLFLFGRTTLLTRLFPNNRISSRFAPARDPDRDAPYPADWVSGACMLVRRAAIDEVGPPDPAFFFAWEDADWCFRMRAAGWGVHCHHEPLAVHVEGGSSERGWRSLWLTTVEFHRGAYRYYRKHMNARRWDPTHIVVATGLAVRSLLLLGGRSLAKIAGSRDRSSGAGRSRDLESPAAR
jgi:GT2 family glycosyltransferase